jgi:phosphoglucomutase
MRKLDATRSETTSPIIASPSGDLSTKKKARRRDGTFERVSTKRDDLPRARTKGTSLVSVRAQKSLSPETRAILKALALSPHQLGDMRRALFDRIGRGLERDGTEIACLLAQLPPPPQGLDGEAMVVDCGGTNIRGAHVAFEDGRARIVSRSSSTKIRDLARALKDANDTTGDGFFQAQAALLRTLEVGEGPMALGYCCSFPASVDASRDAKILELAKEIEIAGVEGSMGGRRLAEATEAEGIGVLGTCVTNDTVACLIGGAASIPHEDKSRFISLIAGTGTNIAGFFSPSQSPKIAKAGWTEKMAINLETAAFDPPHLTRWDDAVDAASARPGTARYEKALSGHYLPYLLKAIRPDLPFDPEEGTLAVVRIRDDKGSDPDARAIAAALLDRSADLVAVGLAAVLDHYGPGPTVKIVAEGTMMKKTPGYAERLERTLSGLLEASGAKSGFEIQRLDDVNFVGAAAGALIPRTRGATVDGLEDAIASGALVLDGASRARIDDWARDPGDRAKIEALIAKQDWNEIRDAFSAELAFGTAGLRGKMGVGPNRMNERTVAVATQALADLVRETGGAERGVVVSFDTRLGSDRFAAITRDLLAKNGIKVFAFEGDRPMPEMSFAIRETGAVAGVMITASHNPKIYNGYKVSWDHGGQIGKEIADAILEKMAGIDGAAIPQAAGAETLRGETVPLGRDMDERYLASIDAHVTDRRALGQLKVVYDPLYGCGRALVPEALRRAGVKPENLIRVEAHAHAPKDAALGDFVGLASPNPSSAGTLDRAIAKAKAIGADLVLATDPDSDRLVAAIPDHGTWRVLRANETWPVVLDERLKALKARGELDPKGAVVRSWVTTSLLDKIAGAYGLETIETPTGFKWIADAMLERNVLGGFEESDGMSVGSHTREKDAQLAAVLVAQAAGTLRARGQTLGDGLDALYARYGRHQAIVEDLTFDGVEGRAAIDRIRSLLAKTPEKVFTEAGASIEPRYDGVRAKLEDGTTITVRPSGTEPKVKVYVEAVGAPEDASRLLADVSARIRRAASGVS